MIHTHKGTQKEVYTINIFPKYQYATWRIQEKHTSYDEINNCRECGPNHFQPGVNKRFEDEVELPGYMQILGHFELKKINADYKKQI